jgi:hypothetical protein
MLDRITAASLLLSAIGTIFFQTGGKSLAAEPRTRAFAISAEQQRELLLMRAIGMMPAGQDATDFGRREVVRVADDWTVTEVPVEYLERCTEAALIQTAALGLLPELAADGDVAAALDKKTLDARQGARALVDWWTAEILAEWQIAEDKPLTSQEVLRLDAQRHHALRESGAAPEGVLTAQWLLFPMGINVLPGTTVRKPVSFRMLLSRFEPNAKVTERNADAVAEELIWTRRLGLGDGTPTGLPQARRTVQALLLERMGFEIGDPSDPDPAKRKDAIAKLSRARKTCVEAWKAKQ